MHKEKIHKQSGGREHNEAKKQTVEWKKKKPNSKQNTTQKGITTNKIEK